MAEPQVGLTPAEEKELAELEAQFGTGRPQVQGLTPEENAELEMLEAEEAQKNKGMGRKALEALGTAVDYGAGLGRTAVGGTVGALSGQDVLQEGDITKALKGEAVPGEELLRRMDVPEGPRFNLMPEMRVPMTDVTLGKGDVSARDIGGFALETAADPLTYATFGGSAVAKGLRPMAKLTEKTGETIYKSGFKKIDEALAKKGKKPLSSVMLEEGAWGGPKSIQEQAVRLSDKFANQRQGLYQTADELGAKIDMSRASEPARQYAEHLQKTRGAEKTGKRLEKYIDEYSKGTKEVVEEVPDHKMIMEMDPLTGQKVERAVALDDIRPGSIMTKTVTKTESAALPNIPIQEASDVKTRFWDELPDSAFNKAGKIKGDAKKIAAKMGEGTEKEIVRAANLAQPGLGERIREVNKNWGSVLTAQKPIQTEVSKATTKNLVSSIDALGAGYALRNPVTGIPMFVGKKMGDVSKGMTFRTGAGLGLQRLGAGGLTGPAMDIITRRSLASPWVSMDTKGRK